MITLIVKGGIVDVSRELSQRKFHVLSIEQHVKYNETRVTIDRQEDTLQRVLWWFNDGYNHTVPGMNPFPSGTLLWYTMQEDR